MRMAADVRAREETYAEELKRIVAMLFALADLAVRAHGLPRPVRAFVLWILRWGEAAARDFVVGPAPDHALPIGECGGEPADALAHAESFRALAVALQDELAWHRRFGGRRRDRAAAGADDAERGVDRADRRVGVTRWLSWLAGFAPAPRLDTS